MIEGLDFLPSDFNIYLKIFIYVLIILHLSAFAIWCALACPTMFKRQRTFSDNVEEMIRKNKQKHS